jgi:sugar lactone lactonase YvrE
MGDSPGEPPALERLAARRRGMSAGTGQALWAALLLVACGGSTDDAGSSGRAAPSYKLGGFVAGLDEGFVEIRNGLERLRIQAQPTGPVQDQPFAFATPLPAGTGYDVQIVNDPFVEFGLSCDVARGSGAMPAQAVADVLVRCARVRSVRLHAGALTPTRGRDGLAEDVAFVEPHSMAVDAAGNVYVTDKADHTVRRISPAGVVTTVAGTSGIYGHQDAVGTSARFNSPEGIAVDAAGNVYVADTDNRAIRRITAAGVVSTIARSPSSAVCGGAPLGAWKPSGIVVDRSGTVIFADTEGRRILSFDTNYRCFQQPGADLFAPPLRFDPRGLALDRTGALLVADAGGRQVLRFDPLPGRFTRADAGVHAFVSPAGVAVDSTGQIIVSDAGNHAVYRIAADRTVSLAAGGPNLAALVDATGAEARFFTPRGLATDAGGNILVADSGNRVLRRVLPGLQVQTAAGVATAAGHAEGRGEQARFRGPRGLAADAAGTLYVADTENHAIRRITADGQVSTLAGAAGLAGHSDGPAALARFFKPIGVALGADGSLYVADSGNHTLRVISPAGVVSTLAGSPGRYGAADGIADAARFDTPHGITVSAAGALYVADAGNHLIRKVSRSGVVETVAGLPGQPGANTDPPSSAFRNCENVNSPNFILGSAARFFSPQGIVALADGSLLVTDTENQTLRRIAACGETQTIAGVVGEIGATDGTTAARFFRPEGIAVDEIGTLYVADTSNHLLRSARRNPQQQLEVLTAAGAVGSTRMDLGPLPGTVGTPHTIAVTSRRVYFTSDHAVLFIDR